MNRSVERTGSRWLGYALCTTVTFLLLLPAQALTQSGKRPLTHDDYDDWKSIRSQQISANGRWVTYQVTPQDGDGELVIRSLRDATEHRFERGAGARFSRDSRFVAFRVAPHEDSIKAAEDADRKGPNLPKSEMIILNLDDGTQTSILRVRNFQMPDETGGWLAYLLEEPPTPEEEEGEEETEEAGAAEEPAQRPGRGGQGGSGDENGDKDYGTELVLRSLADGSETSLKSVLSYRFTEEADWFLYIVSSKEDSTSDGVYAMQPGREESRALLTGVGNYERWTMNKDETHLAFLTDRDDYESDPSTWNLYGWKVGDLTAELWVSHTSTPGFPAGMSVSNLSGLSFTEDGSIALFGIKEKPEPKEEPEEGEEAEEEEEEEVAEFELWSWNDPYPYPKQKIIADRVNNQTFESVYHINSGRFVQLADEDLPDVSLHWSGKIAYGQTDLPYTKRESFDTSYYDFYLIDPVTGERTRVVEENYNRISVSPLAGYLYWWGYDRHWYVYDVAAGTTTNLTCNLPVPVWNREDDTPSAMGSYGIAGWTDDEATILVNDHYDIWEMKPDGSDARCITEGYGRANDLRFRITRMDPDARTFTPNEWMLLRTTNVETMASGVYRDRVSGTREPQMLHMGDYSYGGPQKAEDTDTILTTRQTFYEFPDLWITDMSFADWDKISDVGAQRDQFIWGKSELVPYIDAWGAEYKGILIKPENFDPTKKYPMLVYIYETLTSGVHRFRSPSPGTSINLSYYVSNGYIIWQPDIYYGTGHPGRDAVDCVVPSIKKIISLGFVDPERIGLQGHSWGGYQGAYMITQTDIFAAIESGAPVSNMTSAYGGIRWGSGLVRQMQYEHTQSRLGRNLWDGGMMRYIENSPVFFADRINTPVLILHNDEDGAVPWYQGIELIMTLRRLEKPAWMFNYNGEAHGLRQRVNQKDFTVRMQEFFDHYLKGAPMPDWMKNGIQAWDKEK